MCLTCGCDDAKPRISNMQTGKESPLEPHADTHTHADGTTHSHAHETHEHTHADGTTHSHAHEAHEHTHADGTTHSHAHEKAHTHSNEHNAKSTIELNASILAKNDALAKRNREWLAEREILALNLVSSPGSGKTTLLERTIRDLKGHLNINVIEGDQETANDAKRIKETGCDVVQINTGAGCHLESDMIARGFEQLKPPSRSVVMIENVGNLVCPALFDLGERCKVAVLSVTEGEDKPVKYPHMFRAAEIMILNKIDLLPYVKFDVDACVNHALSVNPKIRVIKVSATSGENLSEWYDWLKQEASVAVKAKATR
jgi:hydrogenase nickel incorporation protein HypB